MAEKTPSSCDTFVVMADLTEDGSVIFGKNSDRPVGEVQELVFVPGQRFNDGDKLQCTYIEIPQAPRTLGTVLSKPSWMWGAEMGVNEAGVAIGNEAVWTKLSDEADDLQARLLGMDLLRLGLERGSSAEEAMSVITRLLEQHGQGGQCSNIYEDFYYHNSFLIVDDKEAWVLETAAKHWVAERVTDGVRNISNCLSIGEKIDRRSEGLYELAQSKGWWDGKRPFNWKDSMSEAGSGNLGSADIRMEKGRKLLLKFSDANQFDAFSMMKVLRDEESLICRPTWDKSHRCPTAASQVSLLKAGNDPTHFFTGIPNPQVALFKPIPSWKSMNERGFLSKFTKSGISFPSKAENVTEYAHELYKCHFNADLRNNEKLIALLRNEEKVLLGKIKSNEANSEEFTFDDIVRKEMEFYAVK